MSGSFISLARISRASTSLSESLNGISAWAGDPGDAFYNVGRRSAPRLRLSIPARLMTITEIRKTILLDISRSGAQISLERPMQVGEAGFLTFAQLEVFACVVRKGVGVNGLEFDVPLIDADVLAVRHFAEAYDAKERQSLKEEAREWVMGRG